MEITDSFTIKAEIERFLIQGRAQGNKEVRKLICKILDEDRAQKVIQTEIESKMVEIQRHNESIRVRESVKTQTILDFAILLDALSRGQDDRQFDVQDLFNYRQMEQREEGRPHIQDMVRLIRLAYCSDPFGDLPRED